LPGVSIVEFYESPFWQAGRPAGAARAVRHDKAAAPGEGGGGLSFNVVSTPAWAGLHQFWLLLLRLLPWAEAAKVSARTSARVRWLMKVLSYG